MSATGIAAASSSPAGGDLFKLPRELRDKIYKNLFCHTYTVYGQKSWHSDRIGNSLPEAKPDLSILPCCRAVSEEAKLALYSNAVFRFALSVGTEGLVPPLPRSVMDRMMNVDFIVNVAWFEDRYRNGFRAESPYKKMKWFYKNVISAFVGKTIKRKTCGIKLWGVEFPYKGVMTSDLGQTLRLLTGFKKVVVEVEDTNFSIYYGRRDLETTSEMESDSGETSNRDDSSRQPEWAKELDPFLTKGCHGCTEMLKAALEPSLGQTEIQAVSVLLDKPTGFIMVFEPPEPAGKAIKKDELEHNEPN